MQAPFERAQQRFDGSPRRLLQFFMTHQERAYTRGQLLTLRLDRQDKKNALTRARSAIPSPPATSPPAT
ncbi:hypothetical protein HKT54_34735, partial [Pseudomonas aeruginosa]|nr:hypothetical protein [Pseudomonas aeruginosa]